MIKKIIIMVLCISSFRGYAQYSSISLKTGLFNSNELAFLETEPYLTSLDRNILLGLDYKTFLYRYGREHAGVDLGFGASFSTIMRRNEGLPYDFSSTSGELLSSIFNQNKVTYIGSAANSVFRTINILQIGPAANLKLTSKMRLAFFYGLGIGFKRVRNTTSYLDGEYFGTNSVSNIAAALNEDEIQGPITLVDNSNAPEFELTIAESVRQSFVSSITRSSAWEIGFEYDLNDRISLGLSYSNLNLYNGYNYKDRGSKVKGKTLNYQSTGAAAVVGETDNFSETYKADATTNLNFKRFERGKPESIGNTMTFKLIMFL
jgi:hypothetical protein